MSTFLKTLIILDFILSAMVRIGNNNFFFLTKKRKFHQCSEIIEAK